MQKKNGSFFFPNMQKKLAEGTGYMYEASPYYMYTEVQLYYTYLLLKKYYIGSELATEPAATWQAYLAGSCPPSCGEGQGAQCWPEEGGVLSQVQ